MAGTSMTLLKLLARVRPEIWELVGGGPLGPHSGPVPDPWKWGWRQQAQQLADAPFPLPWTLSSQLATADLARRIVDAASLTQVQGGDGPGILKRTLDDGDWGVEGRPPVIRLPRDWWKVDEPKPPRPNEIDYFDLVAPLASAGLTFTLLGQRIDDEDLSTTASETGLQILDMATEYCDGL